jgi:hypothetical protein
VVRICLRASTVIDVLAALSIRELNLPLTGHLR